MLKLHDSSISKRQPNVSREYNERNNDNSLRHITIGAVAVFCVLWPLNSCSS